MTKDKMTSAEKERLEGMEIFFNVDICPAFECPEEGCTECPIRRVVDAQEDLIIAVSEAIRNH
jgi:hypothetical protein